MRALINNEAAVQRAVSAGTHEKQQAGGAVQRTHAVMLALTLDRRHILLRSTRAMRRYATAVHQARAAMAHAARTMSLQTALAAWRRTAKFASGSYARYVQIARMCSVRLVAGSLARWATAARTTARLLASFAQVVCLVLYDLFPESSLCMSLFWWGSCLLFLVFTMTRFILNVCESAWCCVVLHSSVQRFRAWVPAAHSHAPHKSLLEPLTNCPGRSHKAGRSF
jgi:hypothetical protein